MKFQTINEYIAAVTNNEMTAVDAASDMFPKMGYAVEYYRVSAASDRPALQAIKAAYLDLENGVTVKTTMAPEIQVECSCGHTVSKINVMTTSAGTSCPDCYDIISDKTVTTVIPKPSPQAEIAVGKKTTMEYTHQQIGGYDKNDKRMYPRNGVIQASDVFESPAYSGCFVRDITFLPDDRRLPNLSVRVEEVKNPAAVALGRLGGSVKSEKKSKSSAANGAKGGRPHKTPANPAE